MPDLLLGLIGDNIAASQAPRLHRLAGELSGRSVRYDRLVPAEMARDFEAVFRFCRDRGYRGVNITYPYKERALAQVRVDDPRVRALGAVNTVLFEPDGARGFNTDHSGFIAAYRGTMGDSAPGPVCLIGAGGVGKAAAFGLLALGVEELRICERDLAKAEALAAALLRARPGLSVAVYAAAAEAAAGAAGLINCTPVGMVGYGGTPLPRADMAGASWAFDAVYTPLDTPFLNDASREGLTRISGYELFFHQGVDAWALFSGGAADPAALRRALAAEAN